MPNDTTPAPIGADALREALWNDALASFEGIIGDEMERV